MPPETAAGQPLLPDQRLIQPAVAALQQQLIDQSHRIELRRVALGSVIADGQRRPRRERIGLARALLFLLARLGDVRLRLPRRRGDPAEVLAHPGERLRRVDVAGHDQHRVTRRVVGFEELPHVAQRCRVEMLEIAVEVVRVVPVGVRHLRQIEPREPAIGLIEDVDLDLVLHHRLLIGQIVLGDVEAAHAVGFGPQHRLEGLARDDLVIVREVEAGRSVECAAIRFDQADECVLAEMLGALEHHVLEQVGEPGPVLRLDAEPDVVVHANHRGRRRRVPRQHDLQPVRQRVVLDRNVQRRAAALTGRGGGRQGHGRRHRQDGKPSESCGHGMCAPWRHGIMPRPHRGGVGLNVQRSGFKVQGSRFRVQGSGGTAKWAPRWRGERASRQRGVTRRTASSVRA